MARLHDIDPYSFRRGTKMVIALHLRRVVARIWSNTPLLNEFEPFKGLSAKGAFKKCLVVELINFLATEIGRPRSFSRGVFDHQSDNA